MILEKKSSHATFGSGAPGGGGVLLQAWSQDLGVDREFYVIIHIINK